MRAVESPTCSAQPLVLFMLAFASYFEHGCKGLCCVALFSMKECSLLFIVLSCLSLCDILAFVLSFHTCTSFFLHSYDGGPQMKEQRPYAGTREHPAVGEAY